MLTAAYAVRFYWGAFVAPRRQWHDRSGPYTAPPSTVLVAPAAVLALVGVVLGVAPWIADPLATASVAALGEASEVHLSVWHGFGVPLLLSALALVGGALTLAGVALTVRGSRQPAPSPTPRLSPACLRKACLAITHGVQIQIR